MSEAIQPRFALARMIIQRLERLSADSAWAHIASGYRGSFLRLIERLEGLPEIEQATPQDAAGLDFLIDQGLDLLAKAARELGDPEMGRFARQHRGK